ncbi:MAG: HD domain-containing protein [Candidatus Latescibacteria bacterium]|nr:HD domain-containing protein [Candidatus Latescibacterota bacterium]
MYEIRDPVHGFIVLNEWEWDIINHPIFQRLRRIRQLGLTDMVYPGAMHTRFEHSLGVMHIASRMFEEIESRRKDFLENAMGYNEEGLKRDKYLLRIASLLHDIGHAPFSHVAETLMPQKPNSTKKFEHEDYSAASIVYKLKDVIEDHPINQTNYNITVYDIENILMGSPQLKNRILWRDILSSQLDADRADYLLRDSYHIGVEYGKYDLNRLLKTITVAIDPETEQPRLAVQLDGVHTAEALIIARYMMFTQVYFHHTRRAYDYHMGMAIQHQLGKKKQTTPESVTFPPPTNRNNVKKYLEWNDCKVMGSINDGKSGEHGEIIKKRNHYRCIFETKEVPDQNDLERYENIYNNLKDILTFTDSTTNIWYKFDDKDIKILEQENTTGEKLILLSQLSSVVRGLNTVNQKRIYVPYEERRKAQERIKGI